VISVADHKANAAKDVLEVHDLLAHIHLSGAFEIFQTFELETV
jgi:hypothetical protein